MKRVFGDRCHDGRKGCQELTAAQSYKWRFVLLGLSTVLLVCTQNAATGQGAPSNPSEGGIEITVLYDNSLIGKPLV
jgi:hypothetical protein